MQSVIPRVVYLTVTLLESISLIQPSQAGLAPQKHEGWKSDVVSEIRSVTAWGEAMVGTSIPSRWTQRKLRMGM